MTSDAPSRAPIPRRGSWPRRIAKRLLLLFAGCFLALLVGECGIRVAAPLLPLPLRAFVREEARAQARSALRVSRKTQVILSKTDFKDAGVLVVGDSMTFGTMVSGEQTFSALLEAQTGRNVLNLGVPSAGPSLYAGLVEMALPKPVVPPDLVLFCVFANDFRQAQAAVKPPGNTVIWRSEFKKDTGLRIRHAREWLFQRSILYQLAKNMMATRLLPRPEQAEDSKTFEGESFEFVFASPRYWRPFLDYRASWVTRGLADTVYCAERTREMAGACSARFLVVLLPFKEQIHVPPLIASGDLPESFAEPWYDATYDMFKRKLEGRNIEAVDLRPAFRKRAAGGERLFFTVDGHLDPSGHRAVAEELAPLLHGPR